jgi:hypothetical protein
VAQIPPMSGSERLLHALMQCDAELDVWISQSEENALLFIENPVAAMQAATAESEPDMEDVLALEAVLSRLARKLDLPLTMHAEKALENPS